MTLIEFFADAKAAIVEDREFASLAKEIGAGDIPASLVHETLNVTMAGVVGEEVVGNIAGSAGSGIGTVIGLPTGWGAIGTGILGGMVFGAIGDEIGKQTGMYLMESAYDQETEE